MEYIVTADVIVSALNDLLEKDPDGISRLVLNHQVLDIPMDHRYDMPFTCALNGNGELEMGAIGLLNGVLANQNVSIGYVVDTSYGGKPVGVVKEFVLVPTGIMK